MAEQPSFSPQHFSPVKFWAQHVLPIVYDDSLSYYEILTKLVNAINSFVPNINDTNDTMKTVVDFVNQFYTDITTQQNTFESKINNDFATLSNQLNADIEAWEQENAQKLQAQYDKFLQDYQKQFGIVQDKGNSTTDAMSQNASSTLLYNFRGYPETGTHIDGAWLRDHNHIGTWIFNVNLNLTGLPEGVTWGYLCNFDANALIIANTNTYVANVLYDTVEINWRRVYTDNQLLVSGTGEALDRAMTQYSASQLFYHFKKEITVADNINGDWVRDRNNIGTWNFASHGDPIPGLPGDIDFNQGGYVVNLTYIVLVFNRDTATKREIMYYAKVYYDTDAISWTKIPTYNQIAQIYGDNTQILMSQDAVSRYMAHYKGYINDTHIDGEWLNNSANVGTWGFYTGTTGVPDGFTVGFLVNFIACAILIGRNKMYVTYAPAGTEELTWNEIPLDYISYQYHGTISADATINGAWGIDKNNIGSWLFHASSTPSGLPDVIDSSRNGGYILNLGNVIFVSGYDTNQFPVLYYSQTAYQTGEIVWKPIVPKKPTLGVIGDSFCDGDYSQYKSTPMARLMNKYGYNGINMAVNGIAASKWWASRGGEVARKNPCDIYIVALGLNVDEAGTGTVDDEPAQDSTFAAGIKFIINQLTEINPCARIILWGMDAFMHEDKANVLLEIGKRYALETYCMKSNMNIPIRIGGKYASVATLDSAFVAAKDKAYRVSDSNQHPNEAAREMLAQYWSRIL